MSIERLKLSGEKYCSIKSFARRPRVSLLEGLLYSSVNAAAAESMSGSAHVVTLQYVSKSIWSGRTGTIVYEIGIELSGLQNSVVEL